MNRTNNHGLPASFVKALERDPYSKGESDFSATGLLKPPQITKLEEEHSDDMTVDVMDEVWSLFGRGVHNVLEAAHDGDNVVLEERLFAKMEVQLLGREPQTVTISGALDVWNPDEGTISDYKVTSYYKVMKGKYDEWEQQLNIYDWLARQNGRDVKAIEIIAIMRDWKKSAAQKQSSYPQAPVQVIPINLWSKDRQETFIRERVALHLEEGVVQCSKEETWNGIRCKDWCSVSQFCPQYGGYGG